MKSILKPSLIILSLSCFLSTTYAAPAVSRARAAELALHRIENLVILKKIQPTHVARMRSLSLSVLNRKTDEEPAFLATAIQFPATDGSASAVQIPLKVDGKALKQIETLGSEPVAAPLWPNVDAVTLAENALHCLQGEKLDNQRPDLCVSSEIAAYGSEFSSLVLTQFNGSTGPIAIIDIRATHANPVLRIRLKADGTPIDEAPITWIQD